MGFTMGNPRVKWMMNRATPMTEETRWGFPEMGGIPKWLVFVRENPLKMDDLGVAIFQETTIWKAKAPSLDVPTSICTASRSTSLRSADRRGKLSHGMML